LNYTFIRALAPLVAAFAVSVALAASAQNAPAKDDHPTLPPGEGREVMIRVCSQCHQPENVVGQELDEAGWKGVVDQMAANGAEATEAELKQIVQYLAKAFPPAK
jgi:competence protein ComEA